MLAPNANEVIWGIVLRKVNWIISCPCPFVKGIVVKVFSIIFSCSLVWWIAIYNITILMLILTIINGRNFKSLKSLKALKSIKSLKSPKALDALKSLKALKALKALKFTKSIKPTQVLNSKASFCC